MRKRMRRVGIVFLCLWMLCALCVSAAPLDTEHTCTLSLRYAYDGVAMAGETVSLYRVAEAHADGTFTLVAPFSEYRVSVHDVTDSTAWKTVAATLYSYAVADRLTPTAVDTVAEDGRVAFADLDTGLYLVGGLTVTKDSGIYVFDSFMAYLPQQQGDEFVYDVAAAPKGIRYDPLPQEMTYRVTKLWQDAGHPTARPTSVAVTLYENGQLRDTVTLSAENDWSYTWTDDGVGTWTVAEPTVPAGYTVALWADGTVFTLTNTYTVTDEPAPLPPSTGDTVPLMLYVAALCLSGMALVLVALALLRGERYEKKH